MTSGAYTICGANVDSWDHALLHCVASMCVWALLDEDLTEVIASLNLLDPKQWLFFIYYTEYATDRFHQDYFNLLGDLGGTKEDQP